MSEPSWVRKNWLGLIGLIIGITGLASSYYFYTQSVKEKEPIFIEEPLRTLIVEAASLKNFPLKVVNRDGKPVEKDITSFRAYFWNNGKESIKSTDILKPIEIILDSEDVQIIDLKIINSTRKDIVNPELKLISKNRMGVKFDILEKSDGFSIQVLFAGPSTAKLQFNGVIEGVDYIQTNGNISSYHFYKTLFMLLGLPVVLTIFLFLFVLFAKPTAAKSLVPVLGGVVDDIQGKSRSFRMTFIVALFISMFVIPFVLYEQEKQKIATKADESLMGVIPDVIRVGSSNKQIN